VKFGWEKRCRMDIAGKFSDDKDRRPDQRGREETDRNFVATFADGPYRPGSTSRSDSLDDPDRIFAESGATKPARRQESRKIRYIGFTGHKDPQIHLYMLKVAADHGFRFDAVQMPLNVMDAHFRSFAHLVVPELVKKKSESSV